MAGHRPIPPPRRSPAAQVGVVALRILLMAVPPCTLGFLAFVPLVRVAAVRRRAVDWVLCCVVALLSVAGFALIATSDDDSWQTAVGLMDIFGLALLCPLYFLVAELRWQNGRSASAYLPVPGHPLPYPAPYQYPNAGVPPYSAPPPYPVPPAPPSTPAPRPAPAPIPGPASSANDRIGQVRAELDELSAYLQTQQQEQQRQQGQGR